MPNDQKYLELLLKPLQDCAAYKPKFGTDDAGGVSIEQFKNIVTVQR